MLLSFDKYQALGNDFIIIDNESKAFPCHDRGYIQFLCNRKEGIGADGLLLIQKSLHADFCMRIFNQDGSEANMCGNGLRCAALFGFHQNKAGGFMRVQSGDIIADVEIQEEKIVTEWGPYTWVHKDPVMVENYPFYALNTGVLHGITFAQNFDDFIAVAPIARRHDAFGANGANISFIVQKEGLLHMRTFEKGVENETLACGSAAAAAAIIRSHLDPLQASSSIYFHLGDHITVEVKDTRIRVHGKATFVFRGSIMYNKSSKKMRSFP